MAIPGKNSFLLYHDQIDMIDAMSDEQAGILIKAVFRYSTSGITSELNDPFVKMAFIAFKAAIDRSCKKYQETVVKRNQKNGKLGGRPRKPSGLKKTQWVKKNPKNPKEPKKADSDSVSDSVSVF